MGHPEFAKRTLTFILASALNSSLRPQATTTVSGRVVRVGIDETEAQQHPCKIKSIYCDYKNYVIDVRATIEMRARVGVWWAAK